MKRVKNFASTKATKKLISKTKKSLKDAARKGRLQAQRNELTYIENLLGEDFESLTQARNALKREVTTVKKRVTKSLPKQLKKVTPKNIKKTVLKSLKKTISKATSELLKPIYQPKEHPYKQSQPRIDVSPKKRIYTLRELKDGDKRSVMEYMQDRLNANALDRELLKPGESWAAQVRYKYRGVDGKTHDGYANTYNIYASSYALFKRLSGYVEHSKISANKKAEWLNQIKIIRWNGTDANYKAKKNAEVSKQNERRKKVSKKLKGKKNANTKTNKRK